MPLRLLLVLGGPVLLLTACFPETPSITTEWSTPLQEIGLLPVDPPNEDVRVGDIYAYRRDPEPATSDPSAFWIGRDPRWAMLPVNEDLNAQYRERPPWPETAEAAARVQGRLPELGTLFAPGEDPRRLRTVNISSVVATISGREKASALIPVEAANIVAGTAWDDYKAITVSIRSSEGYALGLGTVLTLLVDELDSAGGTRHVVKDAYRRRLSLLAAPDSDRLWMRVLTEVIYLRSIDFTVQSARPPDEFQDKPPPDVTALAPPPSGRPAGEDPEIKPFERAAEINTLLAEHGLVQAPGSAIRVISVTGDSMALRRTWSRALAIAARGITLEVDKTTGEVLRIGPMGLPRQQVYTGSAVTGLAPAAPPAPAPGTDPADGPPSDL